LNADSIWQPHIPVSAAETASRAKASAGHRRNLQIIAAVRDGVFSHQRHHLSSGVSNISKSAEKSKLNKFQICPLSDNESNAGKFA